MELCPNTINNISIPFVNVESFFEIKLSSVLICYICNNIFLFVPASPSKCLRVGLCPLTVGPFYFSPTFLFLLGRHTGLPLCYCLIIHSSMLAHFAFSHPRGINFVYASRDQWLQNSPITKFCFIIVQLSILRYCVSLWRRLHLF